MESNNNIDHSSDDFFDGDGEDFDQSSYLESELKKALIRLQDCQKDRNLNSCFYCDNWQECEIRKNYVSYVYKKMSNSEDGEFDF